MPGYKQTEVGVIPEDWDDRAIESLTPHNRKYGIVDGPFGSNLKSIHYRKSGIPIISSGYVTNGVFQADEYLFVDEEKFKQEIRSAVKGGDIVMAKIGARCGASAILPIDHRISILSGNALKITIDESRYSTFYVWQILKGLYDKGELDLIRTTGAQPAISLVSLKRVQIPIPPTKAEQEAIAEALSDADALIESLEQLIAKKRHLKQGTMQELLTGEKRLPGLTRLGWKTSEVGEIPKDWQAVEIRKIADVKTGPFGSALHERDYVDDGTPIITVEHLGERGVVHSNLPGVSDEDRRRLSAYSLEEGDIVFSRVGSVDRNARISKAEHGWLFSGRLLRLRRIDDNVDTNYLSYHFHFEPFKRRVRTVAVGQTMACLNTQLLGAVFVVLPPRCEQSAIAAILSDMDAEIAALEAKLAKYRQLKQGMMHNLLTGRIRLI